MPRFRRLSGPEVLAILGHFGFEVVSQRGSHAKLRRVNDRGVRETPAVPLHDELDIGTCRAILRQASCYVDGDALSRFFYAE
ncbi:MAG: type II toxin-antitoxin system HicA family toxin [Thermoflexaceae bacterium]|nr:type II toxin-antitoxin system HicA family toxin [Thermoflexaceae bacterium]